MPLIHRSAWNMNSRKFTCRILHNHVPIPLESPSPDTPHSPAPVPLVTSMNRYAGLWLLSRNKLMFAPRGESLEAFLPGPLGPGLSAFEVVFLFDVQGLPHHDTVTHHVFSGRVFPDNTRCGGIRSRAADSKRSVTRACSLHSSRSRRRSSHSAASCVSYKCAR